MKTIFIAVLAGIAGCAAIQPAAAANAVTWKESVLHAFDGASGAEPVAGVIDVNGTLYGTTSLGGAYAVRRNRGGGTVFSLDSRTGAETLLWSFGKPARLGSGPMAGVIDVNGTLYGTTIDGGCRGCGGTVFSLDPATRTHKVLYGFPCSGSQCPDGAQPVAGLISLNGLLYGTTTYGGLGAGTVFSVDPGTGAETVLYAFAGGSDGAEPVGSLVAVNGILYGTTSAGGGSGNNGIVFSVDLATGIETVVHAFEKTDGLGPTGLIDVNGTLYGVAGFGGNLNTGCYGGSLGCGTVFSIDPGTGAITVLYAFSGPDGSEPDGLVDVKGMLYGTTFWGGAKSGDGGGTAFSLDPATGAETVLHSFTGGSGDGLYPEPGLI